MAFWLSAAIFTSTALSFMGSMKRMQTLNTSAQWDQYHKRIDASYKTIQANDRARILLSAKRAAQGARGTQIATGSTLMEQNAVVANLEEVKFWIDKGAEISMREIDLKLAGLLQETAWKAGTSLITGMGTAWEASQTQGQ